MGRDILVREVERMGGRGVGTDRGSGKFGGGVSAGTGAGGGGIEGYDKAEQAFARQLFGKNMTGAEIANLAGAGAFKGAGVEIGVRDGRMEVHITHKYIDQKEGGMIISFFKDAKGKRTVEIETMFLTTTAQGKGIGRNAVRAQVQGAKDNKFSNITLFALRKDGGPKPARGPQAWGALGFNAPLSARVTKAWEGRYPLAKFDGIKTPRNVRELFKLKGGRDIWNQYGESGRMVFSLKRGSDSLKAFNAYLKVKGDKPIK